MQDLSNINQFVKSWKRNQLWLVPKLLLDEMIFKMWWSSLRKIFRWYQLFLTWVGISFFIWVDPLFLPTLVGTRACFGGRGFYIIFTGTLVGIRCIFCFTGVLLLVHPGALLIVSWLQAMIVSSSDSVRGPGVLCAFV